MADITIGSQPSPAPTIQLKLHDNGDGSYSFYHVMTDVQQADVVDPLNAIEASNATIATLLAAGVPVTGPLTAAQLTSASLATSAKQDAILTALALLASATDAAVITPNDSTSLTGVKALHVGGAGIVLIDTATSTNVPFTCQAGQRLDIRATKLKVGTTATLIVAYK